MNGGGKKFGGGRGRGPTGTPSLAWSSMVVVVSLPSLLPPRRGLHRAQHLQARHGLRCSPRPRTYAISCLFFYPADPSGGGATRRRRRRRQAEGELSELDGVPVEFIHDGLDSTHPDSVSTMFRVLLYIAQDATARPPPPQSFPNPKSDQHNRSTARNSGEQRPVAGGSTLDPMAVDLILEPQMMSDAVLRERVKVSLLTFPEVAALDTDQLDMAVDRIIRESKPETATPTTPGMCRLSDDDIGAFFYHAIEIPTIDDLVPGGVLPAGWIEERRQQLDREVQPEKKKLGHDLDPLLAKIRVDLLTKGYVDVPELYFHETPEVQAALMEAVKVEHKEYTGVTGPDDDKWWLDDAVVTRCVLESS